MRNGIDHDVIARRHAPARWLVGDVVPGAYGPSLSGPLAQSMWLLRAPISVLEDSHSPFFPSPQSSMSTAPLGGSGEWQFRGPWTSGAADADAHAHWRRCAGRVWPAAEGSAVGLCGPSSEEHLHPRASSSSGGRAMHPALPRGARASSLACRRMQAFPLRWGRPISGHSPRWPSQPRGGAASKQGRGLAGLVLGAWCLVLETWFLPGLGLLEPGGVESNRLICTGTAASWLCPWK